MSKKMVIIDNPDIARGQFLVYEAEDGQIKIDVRLEDETVWLTQQLMAELFQATKQNVRQHLKIIFFRKRVARKFSCKKILYNCRG